MTSSLITAGEPGAVLMGEAERVGRPISDLSSLTGAKPCFPGDGQAICFDVLTRCGKLTEDLFHLL